MLQEKNTRSNQISDGKRVDAILSREHTAINELRTNFLHNRMANNLPEEKWLRHYKLTLSRNMRGNAHI